MTPEDDELRRRVAVAYDEVLREPVPERLSRLLEQPAPVVDLASERSRRREQRARGALAPRNWAQSWAAWGGMAASLAIGVLAGVQFAGKEGNNALLVEHAGHVVAGTALAHALDTRLASDTDPRIGVQLSFVDRAGQYCRTFRAASVAGLACRDNGDWNVVATAQADAKNSGGMRQAASPLPRAVLDTVDARISGNALDATQERAARDRGWQR
jgi:hypothetical protein